MLLQRGNLGQEERASACEYGLQVGVRADAKCDVVVCGHRRINGAKSAGEAARLSLPPDAQIADPVGVDVDHGRFDLDQGGRHVEKIDQFGV